MKPCRFGYKCNRSNCRFSHTSGGDAVVGGWISNNGKNKGGRDSSFSSSLSSDTSTTTIANSSTPSIISDKKKKKKTTRNKKSMMILHHPHSFSAHTSSNDTPTTSTSSNDDTTIAVNYNNHSNSNNNKATDDFCMGNHANQDDHGSTVVANNDGVKEDDVQQREGRRQRPQKGRSSSNQHHVDPRSDVVDNSKDGDNGPNDEVAHHPPRGRANYIGNNDSRCSMMYSTNADNDGGGSTPTTANHFVDSSNDSSSSSTKQQPHQSEQQQQQRSSRRGGQQNHHRRSKNHQRPPSPEKSPNSGVRGSSSSGGRHHQDNQSNRRREQQQPQPPQDQNYHDHRPIDNSVLHFTHNDHHKQPASTNPDSAESSQTTTNIKSNSKSSSSSNHRRGGGRSSNRNHNQNRHHHRRGGAGHQGSGVPSTVDVSHDGAMTTKPQDSTSSSPKSPRSTKVQKRSHSNRQQQQQPQPTHQHSSPRSQDQNAMSRFSSLSFHHHQHHGGVAENVMATNHMQQQQQKQAPPRQVVHQDRYYALQDEDEEGEPPSLTLFSRKRQPLPVVSEVEEEEEGDDEEGQQGEDFIVHSNPPLTTVMGESQPLTVEHSTVPVVPSVAVEAYCQPVVVSSSSGTVSIGMATTTTSKPSPPLCRFGNKCRNQKCTFGHPPKMLAPASTSSFSKNTAKSTNKHPRSTTRRRQQPSPLHPNDDSRESTPFVSLPSARISPPTPPPPHAEEKKEELTAPMAETNFPHEVGSNADMVASATPSSISAAGYWPWRTNCIGGGEGDGVDMVASSRRQEPSSSVASAREEDSSTPTFEADVAIAMASSSASLPPVIVWASHLEERMEQQAREESGSSGVPEDTSDQQQQAPSVAGVQKPLPLPTSESGEIGSSPPPPLPAELLGGSSIMAEAMPLDEPPSLSSSSFSKMVNQPSSVEDVGDDNADLTPLKKSTTGRHGFDRGSKRRRKTTQQQQHHQQQRRHPQEEGTTSATTICLNNHINNRSPRGVDEARREVDQVEDEQNEARQHVSPKVHVLKRQYQDNHHDDSMFEETTAVREQGQEGDPVEPNPLSSRKNRRQALLEKRKRQGRKKSGHAVRQVQEEDHGEINSQQHQLADDDIEAEFCREANRGGDGPEAISTVDEARTNGREQSLEIKQQDHGKPVNAEDHLSNRREDTEVSLTDVLGAGGPLLNPSMSEDDLGKTLEPSDSMEDLQASSSAEQDMDHDDRERYKAVRKAAKKERRRLEQEAKAADEKNRAQEQSTRQSLAESNQGNIDPSIAISQDRDTHADEDAKGNVLGVDVESDEGKENLEEHRKRVRQEEIRRQKERAAEKKKEQKRARYEKYVADLEQQNNERSRFWEDLIAGEQMMVDIMVQLCAAEFCRTKRRDLSRETLLANSNARSTLEDFCRHAYRNLYKDESQNRVVVRGLQKQQDLNDRTGTIQYWDKEKGQFKVGLDTKKGKSTQDIFLMPCNLEAVSQDAAKKAKRNKNVDPVHMLTIDSFFEGGSLWIDLYKSDIERMKNAPSIDTFLDKLVAERNREDLEAKLHEEEERRQEEEARRRRAERRRREEEEWQERQRVYAEQKQRYAEYKRGVRKENQFRQAVHPGPSCPCPECTFRRVFLHRRFGDGAGNPRNAYVFGSRGGPYVFFADDDDDDWYKYHDDDNHNDNEYDENKDAEEEWDRHWNRMHQNKVAMKKKAAADVLGVNVNATASEIKRVYRKKVLKYHPDKFRPENENNMTKEEAEEHFKELASAYDDLMSFFDE